MANVTERFNTVIAKLTEASAEILAQIEKLKEEDLSPEGEVALQTIEAKATAMAEISPPIEPVP